MPTTIVLRSVKGSKLTKDEVDTNFTNLKTTADAAATATALTAEAAARAAGDTKASILAALGIDAFDVTADDVTITKGGKSITLPLE